MGFIDPKSKEMINAEGDGNAASIHLIIIDISEYHTLCQEYTP